MRQQPVALGWNRQVDGKRAARRDIGEADLPDLVQACSWPESRPEVERSSDLAGERAGIQFVNGEVIERNVNLGAFPGPVAADRDKRSVRVTHDAARATVATRARTREHRSDATCPTKEPLCGSQLVAEPLPPSVTGVRAGRKILKRPPEAAELH